MLCCSVKKKNLATPKAIKYACQDKCSYVLQYAKTPLESKKHNTLNISVHAQNGQITNIEHGKKGNKELQAPCASATVST